MIFTVRREPHAYANVYGANIGISNVNQMHISFLLWCIILLYKMEETCNAMEMNGSQGLGIDMNGSHFYISPVFTNTATPSNYSPCSQHYLSANEEEKIPRVYLSFSQSV